MFLQHFFRFSPLERTGILLLLLTVVGVLVVNAWISEDAYISFRVIDNAVHGYGLRWNIDERVQVYTHPLWLLVMLGAYALTQEAYFTSLIISLFFTTVALAIGVFGIARSTTSATFLLLGAALAAPFVDFATSGLEIPLAYLLVVLFYWLLLKNTIPVFWLSTIASLLVLTRHDFLLLVLPTMVWVVWKQWSWKTVRLVLLGLIPFIAWEIFSLIYYGFLFPNTAYAKLDVGIPREALIRQGFRYMADVVVSHPLVAGILIAASAWPAVYNNRKGVLMMVGVLLYLAYIIWIGGDFMTGRFVAVPFWVTLLVFARYWPREKRLQQLVFIGLVVLGVSSARPIWHILEPQTLAENTYRFNGVANEKSFYFPYTGLVFGGSEKLKTHYWVTDARKERESEKIVVRGNVGLYGYFVGPNVHVVDSFGLADPLLSRLTTLDLSHFERTTKTKWRIGHFRRVIPVGYVESLRSGDNKIQDPEIANLYDDLSVITRGPIWSIDRFRKIIEYAT